MPQHATCLEQLRLALRRTGYALGPGQIPPEVLSVRAKELVTNDNTPSDQHPGSPQSVVLSSANSNQYASHLRLLFQKSHQIAPLAPLCQSCIADGTGC